MYVVEYMLQCLFHGGKEAWLNQVQPQIQSWIRRNYGKDQNTPIPLLGPHTPLVGHGDLYSNSYHKSITSK